MAIGGGFKFLGGSKSRQAEEAIAHAESVITVLHLGEIDLSAPEALVQAAKKALEARKFANALSGAQTAERIAVKLEGQHAAYVKAVEALHARMEETKRVGLPLEDMTEALERAQARIRVGVWEDGIEIPDYDSARVIVEDAERAGKEVVEKATTASNAVFMAELAIEALISVPGPKDRDVFEKGGAEALEASLEGATRRLAQRDFDQAIRVAKDIESRANRLRAQFIEAAENLAATSAVLGELRGKGVPTARLGSQLAITRDVLQRGVIDPAAGMARRLFEDARALGEGYAKATSGIADATNRYSALVREGHLSTVADRAILEARHAVRDGQYQEALKYIEEADRAIARAEAERETLAKSLADHRNRMTAPNATPFLNEATEILGRAEKEFKDGDYSGSNEDLVLATLLLGPSASKAGKTGE